MEPQQLIVVGAIVVVGLFAIVGAMRRQRSMARLLLDLAIAAVAGFFAYQAYTGSQDLPWTAAYGAVGLIFLVLALRELRKPGGARA